MSQSNRRPRTIAFTVSEEDFHAIHMRAVVSGKNYRDFYVEMLLNGEVHIAAGRFQSNRLSMEIAKLNERLGQMNVSGEKLYNLLLECRALTGHLAELITEQEVMHHQKNIPKNR